MALTKKFLEPVNWIQIDFPLRVDFTAYVQVPKDITQEEAERLAAMIRTLGLESEADQ